MRTSKVMRMLGKVFTNAANAVVAGVLIMAVLSYFEEPKSSTPILTIEDLINDQSLSIEDLINAPSEVVVPEVPTATATLDTREVGNSLPTAQCGGSDQLWLTCAIYFEARNQSYEGQYWVAQVILNRVEDTRWPNTVEAVVRQDEEKRGRCQFSFMCDGKTEHIRNLAAWETASVVAAAAIEDFYRDARVTCAHSYRASYVTSPSALRWFASLQTDGQVGSHIFYCDSSERVS